MPRSTTRAPEVLSTRALNRALLARQLLLERESRPVFEVVEHLVGMQAQEPRDPYVALWSRLEAFEPAELEQLLRERRVARSPLMRTTIHLATARDCLELRGLVQPVLTRTQRSAFGKRLPGADLDALVAAGRALFEETPRTFAEVRELLGEPWAGFDAQAVTQSISYFVPLVQVPPRGLWSEGGRATWTTTEAWLGEPVPAEAAPDETVMRYLAAFGPASVMDVQAWCGLTRLKAVLERLRPRLVTFHDESGRELFDLPDAPRPDEDTPAPVRFLPQYDNVFLSHADRARIVSDEHRRAAVVANGYVAPLLLDGFIAATWRLERQGGAAMLEVRPFERWSKRDRASVSEEGERLLAFVAPEAGRRDITFVSGG